MTKTSFFDIICTRNNKEAVKMVDSNITIQDASEVDPSLLRMLDRGLEDIEAGRTLPLDQAMEEVRRIRKERRAARMNMGVAANG